MGLGKGMAASGGGLGADNRNTGPRGKLHGVKETVKAATHVGDSGMVFSAGETTGAPDSASPATVPYTDVMSNYKKAAETAISKEKVPPAYRSRVKDYFSTLSK